MVYSGESGPGGATVVRSMESIIATGWHPLPKLYGDRPPLALEAAADSAFSVGVAVSSPTCGANGWPHGSQKDTGPGDEDGLMKGLEGYVVLFC